MKKYKEVAGFSVWIVDGNYIRTNIDEQFNNFGQHYRFKFIPNKEFWIDRESCPGEEKFFIDHLLVENRLMAQGISYNMADEKADRKEQHERAKSRLMENKTTDKRKKGELLKKIHKKFLKQYSNNILKVWIVNGELVRDLFYTDFTEGGHGKVFQFIPEDEIWIDDDVSDRERKFVLLHEMHERNLMKKSKGIKIKKGVVVLTKDYTKIYDSAHESASKIEFFCRRHPDKTKNEIKRELKKAEKI
jgi:hypothetical protein